MNGIYALDEGVHGSSRRAHVRLREETRREATQATKGFASGHPPPSKEGVLAILLPRAEMPRQQTGHGKEITFEEATNECCSHAVRMDLPLDINSEVAATIYCTIM